MDKDLKSVADLAFANVLLLARHDTLSNAAVQCDAATQLAFLKQVNFLTDNSVSMWESIHIEDCGTTRGICGSNEYYQKDLPELSAHYLSTMLKIKITGTLTVQQAVASARKFGTTCIGLATIEEILSKKLPRDEVAKIMVHVNYSLHLEIQNIL
jgi:hypothetical protein